MHDPRQYQYRPAPLAANAAAVHAPHPAHSAAGATIGVATRSAGARLRHGATALVLALVVAAANVVVWRAFNPPLAAPDAPARVAGLAYNAYQRWESPLAQRFPTDAELAADLRLLAPLTPRLRTYSALEFPALPELAAQHGLRVTVGAWLDWRMENNQREVAAAIATARTHRNVERLIVGNETQLHGKLTPAQLASYLAQARAQAGVPVSTAEPWHVWLRQPELARHVDFITIHLLPYWEGVPVEAAVDEALRRYDEVRARFPGQQVVIGEIGWPSGGKAVGVALPTPERQARFVREFLAKVAQRPLDFYLMEAVDQPWKRATEGDVGAHWGLFDAQRRAKFAFAGPLYAQPFWPAQALAASALGLMMMLPFLLRFARMRLAGRVAFALSAQAVASAAVVLFTLPLVNYLRPLDALVLLGLVPALAVMAAILLAQAFEFAELFWHGSLRREAAPLALAAHRPRPYVSLHLACCNEPAEMVIATIDSLVALDWPAFEILVVDNNTHDAARWRPVQAHVDDINRRLARPDPRGRAVRLRFFHLPRWPGFKAGALNFALTQTDPRAAWIGVVDADYIVQPDWLQATAGHCADPTVGIVQAPQAHRAWEGSRLARMMNWEYEGFFRIGMHHRHERNAIVQHGTMTLIRAPALRRAGGWDETCICEDTELGLRLLQQRLHAVYLDQRLGAGLVPADFVAYRRQRTRWAEGAMQIMRRHAGALGGRSPLTLGQRYHFVAGWLPWLGDALHLLFTLAAMTWTLGIMTAPQWFGLPIGLFVVPLAVFFVARLVLVPLLYWRRVPCSPADIAGAALAGMGLSHAVALGVLAGLRGRAARFEVTRKAAGSATVQRKTCGAAWLQPVRDDLALLGGLLACIGAMLVVRTPGDSAMLTWTALLAMQAVPYGAAVACAWLCRSDAAARASKLLDKPATIAGAPAR